MRHTPDTNMRSRRLDGDRNPRTKRRDLQRRDARRAKVQIRMIASTR